MFRYCLSHWLFSPPKLHIFCIPSGVCERAYETAFRPSKDMKIDNETLTDELPYRLSGLKSRIAAPSFSMAWRHWHFTALKMEIHFHRILLIQKWSGRPFFIYVADIFAWSYLYLILTLCVCFESEITENLRTQSF